MLESVLKGSRKRWSLFYHSNGGVTLSGGEPLLQAEFCGEILKGCQIRGINTAVETSSFVPEDNYQKFCHIWMLYILILSAMTQIYTKTDESIE